MLRLFKTSFSLAAFVLAITSPAFASPTQSGLLPLIPGDAQIIAGIEDPHNGQSHGRLLFATHNNNLDFNDWLALAGVDSNFGASELIEVAASSSRGELKEHLLLVKGSFNRERIFHGAEQNGAARAEYKGEEILAVSPFPREKGEMTETRWLAIVDDRISLFGTPLLVQKALDRRATHSLPDSRVVERLTALRSDVNSWNVLAMPPAMLARHLDAQQLDASWRQVLDTIDELTIAVHYGATARIDFTAHAVRGIQPAGTVESSPPQLLPVGLPNAPRVHVKKLTVEGNRARGSIAIPERQLDDWLSALYRARSAPHGAQ